MSKKQSHSHTESTAESPAGSVVDGNEVHDEQPERPGTEAQDEQPERPPQEFKPRFEVETDVPVPTGREPRAEVAQYLSTLQVGHSVRAPIGFRSAAIAYAKKNNMTLVTRTIGPGEVRIWRVESPVVPPTEPPPVPGNGSTESNGETATEGE